MQKLKTFEFSGNPPKTLLFIVQMGGGAATEKHENGRWARMLIKPMEYQKIRNPKNVQKVEMLTFSGNPPKTLIFIIQMAWIKSRRHEFDPGWLGLNPNAAD